MYQNVVVTKDRSVLNQIEEKLNELDLEFLTESIIHNSDDLGKLIITQFTVYGNDTRKVNKIDPELFKMFRSYMDNGAEVTYALEVPSEPFSYNGCERALDQYKNDLGIHWTVAI